MKNEDIKLLIKNEYENGTSIRALAEKYNQKVGTIKSWISRGKWIKKKENSATIKNKNATKKRNQSKMVANDKETQMKLEILNNVPKKEILQKFSITERTYYNKLKSIREIQIEKSKNLLTQIANKNYKDLEEQLTELEEEKRKLKEKFLKISLEEDEVLRQINARLKTLREFEKEIYKGGQIIGNYRQAELEAELENENIQKKKLDLEKKKIEGEQLKDTKVEFKFKEKEIEELEDKKNE
nr:MAG TPA: transposase [Caudoviricetes sp.]